LYKFLIDLFLSHKLQFLLEQALPLVGRVPVELTLATPNGDSMRKAVSFACLPKIKGQKRSFLIRAGMDETRTQ
ncbi:hypothetical protein, partial [Helicobacter heilmannii]|uniref:hypothetical protein n=1 Tax=Helicobacter heilmannii TaxID=35817 RepID=UPI002556847E